MSSELLCGVDEAGRGPLCGPVVAAAVILDPSKMIQGLADSKKLSPKKRAILADEIRARALAWSIAEASVEEIDQLNILGATMLAMQRAVEGLKMCPSRVLVDGNRCPRLKVPVSSLVKGDSLEPAISAASILAKTHRDALMQELDREYPEYGLACHKGYPTAAHLELIKKIGVPSFYRKSFSPVRSLIENDLFHGEAK